MGFPTVCSDKQEEEKERKKKQTFACKRFLNVSVQTQNENVLWWLGRIFYVYCICCTMCKILATNYKLPDERPPQKAYNMWLYLQDLGKKDAGLSCYIACCCICKIWVKRRRTIMLYNMLLYLQDLGKKTWAYHITCCCICKIWVKRRRPIMSKNCCVETALDMSAYSKMLDIWTDLCLF